jgi:hypothetical protein
MGRAVDGGALRLVIAFYCIMEPREARTSGCFGAKVR